jgi:hypothetical protein
LERRFRHPRKQIEHFIRQRYHDCIVPQARPQRTRTSAVI